MAELILVMVLMVFPMIVLGGAYIRGKWVNSISGYYTMKKEERVKYDMEAVGKYVGIYTLRMAAVLTAAVIGNVLEMAWLFNGGVGLMGVLTLIFILNNKKERFLKKEE